MSDLQSIAEKNCRATARGNYTRWLLKRFGSLDMMSVKEGEEKVHLRNIYIPLRIDKEDRADEAMGEIDDVEEEKLPGSDARDIIAEQNFVAISGRPGSGKTTLVQALIDELCAEGASSFRTKLVGKTGILPVPLILRDYQDELEKIRNLDELLDLWWEKAETEAQDKQKFLGTPLDILRLKQSYSKVGDHIPLLLLFDGIDEVGGLEMRNKIIHLAQTAQANHRVVLTGRPSGYDGVRLDQIALVIHEKSSDSSVRTKHSLYYTQPFSWPQIQQFVKKFYLLHDEWKVERQRGIQDINKALQSRQYLLTLARRPIFLTLMALVHINDRRMPHGRADLYRRIIDLYLIRQTHQRRLKNTVKNTPMPHWEEQEVRRGLGYIAWLSQHKGEAEKEEEQDKRQVIWSRQEIADALGQLLRGETGSYHGRFRDIKPEQADELLNYYLNPAGLLVEPAEEQIQFAHLSFQEYLCAEYIHGRALAGGSRRFLESIKKRLYKNLHLPGWDEVGLLLLTIHAGQGAQTEPTAHLELLAELDPTDKAQAKLLINALTGKELDYPGDELPRWLPIAVATVLIHLDEDLVAQVGAVSAWIYNGLGLSLLKKLFAVEDQADGLWNTLLHELRNNPIEIFEQSCLEEFMDGAMREVWCGLHKKPEGNTGQLQDAGFVALLLLAVESGWIQPDPEQPEWHLVAGKTLQDIIAYWLEKQKPILYWRDSNSFSIASTCNMLLGNLVPDRGTFWRSYIEKTPLDYWLLNIDEEFGQCSPSIWLSLCPHTSLPQNIQLALGLYQCLQLTNALTLKQISYIFKKIRRISNKQALRGLSFNMVYQLVMRKDSVLSHTRHMLKFSTPQSVLQFTVKQKKTSDQLHKFLEKITGQEKETSEELAFALERFGYQYAAHDWFLEQAESPDLMQRRGLRPGQPLPPHLELFDTKGLLRSPLKRQAIVNLHEWLQDDQQILDWFFPEGLSDEWQKRLLEEMDILWKQPWSPRHAVQATLDDWPEDLPERETTLAAIEQPLIDALLAAEAEGKAEEE